MSGDRPTGTVTFLFTDIEGSTKLWEDHRAAMQAALPATMSCYGVPSKMAAGTCFRQAETVWRQCSDGPPLP